jgi:hypothetical protein
MNNNIFGSPQSNTRINPLLEDDPDISDSISSDSSSDSDKSLSDMHADNPYNSDVGTNIFIKHTFSQQHKGKIIYDEDESEGSDEKSYKSNRSNERRDIDRFNIESPNIYSYSVTTPSIINNGNTFKNQKIEQKIFSDDKSKKISSSSPSKESIYDDINML